MLIENIKSLINEIDWTIQSEKVRDIVERIREELEAYHNTSVPLDILRRSQSENFALKTEVAYLRKSKQKKVKVCPRCKSRNVEMFDSNNDHCLKCDEVFSGT